MKYRVMLFAVAIAAAALSASIMGKGAPIF